MLVPLSVVPERGVVIPALGVENTSGLWGAVGTALRLGKEEMGKNNV